MIAEVTAGVAGDERDRHLDEGDPGLVGERAECVGGVELSTWMAKASGPGGCQ